MRTALLPLVLCAALAGVRPAAAADARSESFTVSSGPITLSLRDSVSRALEAATTVLKAGIDDRLAAEELLQGYAQFLPNLDLTGSYSKARGVSYLTTGAPTVVDSRNRGDGYQVSSVLNLFSGFSDYGSFKSALDRRRAAALTLERARQEIVFDVAQAYLQVQLDDRVTAIADENAAASRRRQTLLEQQAQVGARSLADLYRQQAQTSSDQALLIQARNKRRDDLILLLRRLRLDLRRDYVLPEVALDSAAVGGPYDDEGALVAAALSARPDLRAAWNQAEAARGGATAARSGFFPRLDLGWSMVSTSRLLDTDIVNGADVLATLPAQRPLDSQLANQIDYTIGVTATWGLFDRLVTRAAAKRAEAAAADARIDYEDARLQVEGDVKQAFGDFHTAELTLAAAREGLKSARESYDAVQARYEVGASTLLDVLTAQTALLQAESALAQGEVGLYLQGRQMEFALGRMPVVASGS
ncbi:MAG TPA: TolC family protein [Elusimicrobiota bacterium]|jgi:outer membrane protein|nr:TolC family protein [Elusimicrobiota bacterium]